MWADRYTINVSFFFSFFSSSSTRAIICFALQESRMHGCMPQRKARNESTPYDVAHSSLDTQTLCASPACQCNAKTELYPATNTNSILFIKRERLLCGASTSLVGAEELVLSFLRSRNKVAVECTPSCGRPIPPPPSRYRVLSKHIVPALHTLAACGSTCLSPCGSGKLAFFFLSFTWLVEWCMLRGVILICRSKVIAELYLGEGSKFRAFSFFYVIFYVYTVIKKKSK